MKKRRTFTREFKLAAVKKVVDQGLSFAEVARELDVRDTYIHTWKKDFLADGTLETDNPSNPSATRSWQFAQCPTLVVSMFIFSAFSSVLSVVSVVQFTQIVRVTTAGGT